VHGPVSCTMLELSHDDVVRLRRAVATLVSPFAHDSLVAWREAARRAVADLTGAHQSGFVLPLGDTPLITGDMQAAAEAWEREYYVLDTGFTQTSRQRGLTIFGFQELYGDVAAFQRSPLYQEWHRPYHAFDALVLATAVPGTSMPTSINLFHDDERTVFGERGRELLSIVEPAFRAGIDAIVRAGAVRAGAAAHIDTLDAAACLLDARGVIVHENVGFAAIAEAPTSARIREFASNLARRVVSVASLDGRAREDATAIGALSRSSLIFRGRLIEWVLTPTLLVEQSGWSGPLVLILARRRSVESDDNTLRSGCGLTPREIDVARALATGLTTADVARRFGLSIHTVRRHAERIYAKLGVSSRSALTALLLGQTRG